MLSFDLHTHTVSSGHGTTDTIADLAKAAHQKGMTALGISDHGPATPGSCQESYFRSLKMAPKNRAGIRLLYGVEANILNPEGQLDLSDVVLSGLDFVLASIHPQSFKSPAYRPVSFFNRKPVMIEEEEARQLNTQAYIRAMESPLVKVIGHPDDQHYPVDCERLVAAAVKQHVILEVNEASLSPEGYRGDTLDTARQLLMLCRQYDHPILLSSDSHGARGVGEAPLCEQLTEELAYPKELVLNRLSPECFLQFRTTGKLHI